MKITILTALSLLGSLLITAGCAGDRSASRLLEISDSRAQADAAVRDVQADLTVLRRDLAAARIAAAKHEAEAGELRRQANMLQTDRTELRRMLDQAQSAITALQSERDELKQAQAQAQTESASVAHHDSNAPARSDMNTVQTDMKELKARIAILTDELMQLKQRFQNKARATSAKNGAELSDRSSDSSLDRAIREGTGQPRTMPGAVSAAPSEPAAGPSHASDLPLQQDVIRVQLGDSLWKLAHEHATTVEELKRANGLTSDVVHTGQRLLLPAPIATWVAP